MSSLKPTIAGLSIALPIIATFAVALRVQSRRIKKAPLGADDYLIFAALFFCYALSIDALCAVYLGNLGGHLQLGPGGIPADPEAFLAFSQSLFAFQILSIPPLGLTKLSVVFLYKRIFISQPFKITMWVFIAILIVWNISFVFANLLDCIPFELNWRPQAGVSGKCIDIIKLFYAVSISDILTDLFILLSPWSQIWKLQMSVARKFQITGVFLLGTFVLAAGIVRFALSAAGVTSQEVDLDYTYTRAPAVYWSIVEANVGVISACLPTMRPLIGHYKVDTLGSTLYSYINRRSGSSGSVTNEKNSSQNKFHNNMESYYVKSGSERNVYGQSSMTETSSTGGDPRALSQEGIRVERSFAHQEYILPQ